jgi:hypothetical protein
MARARADEQAEKERRIALYREQLRINGCLDFAAICSQAARFSQE